MPEPREIPSPFFVSDPANGQRLEGDFSIAYEPSDMASAHDGVAKPDPKGSSVPGPAFSSVSRIPDVPLPAGFVPQAFIIPGDKMPAPIVIEQQELPFIPAPIVAPEPPVIIPIPPVKTEATIAESDMSPAAEKDSTKLKAPKSGTLPS